MSAPTLLLVQLLERGDEVRPDEARVARELGRELGEPLLGDRIAVDRDQRPGGPDPVGDQPRVTAAAERAVHGHLAGLRIEQLDQLAGEHRDVRSGSCQAVWPRLAAMSGTRVSTSSL